MISVFIDTNVLHCDGDNLKEVRFVEKLQRIISEIEINDIYSEVAIIIPRIVIHELFEQQLDAYYGWMGKLKNLDMPNIAIEKDFSYEEYLTDIFKIEIKAFAGQLVKIKIADFPSDNCLEDIIYRSIKKEAPFEGKNKKSDKGFKDVIVWETLKEYKSQHIMETIVFNCNDNLLTAPQLKKEFREEFRDEIYIVKKESLLECLTGLLNKRMEKTFAEQLEDRLKCIFHESNSDFYELMMDDAEWNDGDRIIDFSVNSISILECRDEKIDNRIMYNIEVHILLFYDEIRERAQYKQYGKREFEVCYDFQDDNFYLKEYDALTLGRCKFEDYYCISE